MRQNGIARRGRHRRAHIVYVGNAEIYHFAERCRRYGDAALRFLRRANQRCARARNRPLRLRRTGGAEFQRVAVLPFRGRKVAARGGDYVIRMSRVYGKRGERQRFRHGGTRAVHAEKGHGIIARGERGGNNLIEKIAGNEKIQLVFVDAAVFHRLIYGITEHFTFRLFVRAFAEHIVIQREIHVFAYHARTFFRPRHRAACRHPRQVGEIYRLRFLFTHFYSPLMLCAEKLRQQ